MYVSAKRGSSADRPTREGSIGTCARPAAVPTLSLAALALLAIGTAVGYVLSALFVGRTGFRLVGQPEAHPVLALLAGLLVLTLIGLIPFVGGLVALAAVVFGLGALTLTLFRSWRGPTATAAGVQPAPAAARPPAAGVAGDSDRGTPSPSWGEGWGEGQIRRSTTER